MCLMAALDTKSMIRFLSLAGLAGRAERALPRALKALSFSEYNPARF